MRFRGAAGSFTPIRGWRHNGDPRLAPLRRSSAGAYTPILTWLLYADHRLAPIRRSLTGTEPVIVGTQSHPASPLGAWSRKGLPIAAPALDLPAGRGLVT